MAEPTSILNYEYHDEFVFDTSVYDDDDQYLETTDDAKAHDDVRRM